MTRANEEYRRWMATAAKPHKYGAHPKTVDGIRFASTKEAKRYGELLLLERAGKITDLTLQSKYPLRIGLVTITHYVGDFRYIEGGKVVLEDVKGFATKEFILKAKLFQALYPDIELRIT